MNKKYKYFCLIGKRGFPMDVTRQFQCWPASPIDSNEVVESYKMLRKADELPYVVRMIGEQVPDDKDLKQYHWRLATDQDEHLIRSLRHM